MLFRRQSCPPIGEALDLQSVLTGILQIVFADVLCFPFLIMVFHIIIARRNQEILITAMLHIIETTIMF